MTAGDTRDDGIDDGNVPGTVTIDTALGTIRGVERHGVQHFLGIRFAEPPVGEQRFMPPVRSAAWTGVYDATEFANRAMQPPHSPLLGPPGPGEQSEDCLFLNVFTPGAGTRADAGGRPVLVWIHGGAYTIGSANDYDGSILAAQGDVVVVTINYRLGLFGFLGLSKLGAELEMSGGNGFLDQIAALEWVRDNIADYGGDPGNVTIFGESAGGGSVLAMLASPRADGLFHKAIAHSPGGVNTPPIDQLPVILDHLGGDGSEIDRLRAADAQRLVDIQVAIQFTGGWIDGAVVTRHPTLAVIEHGADGVPLIVGTNHDEGTLFSAIYSMFPGVFEAITPFIATQVTRDADPGPYLAGLREMYPDDSEVAHGERVWVDLFRRTSVEIAAASTEHGPGGWLYRFDIPTTVLDGRLGATHASEMSFTFNWFARDGVGLVMHDRDDEHARDVAKRWSDTLIAFARTGDPNGAGLPEWPTYSTDRRACLVLGPREGDDGGGSGCRIVDDPDGAHRTLWDR